MGNILNYRKPKNEEETVEKKVENEVSKSEESDPDLIQEEDLNQITNVRLSFDEATPRGGGGYITDSSTVDRNGSESGGSTGGRSFLFKMFLFNLSHTKSILHHLLLEKHDKCEIWCNNIIEET